MGAPVKAAPLRRSASRDPGDRVGTLNRPRRVRESGLKALKRIVLRWLPALLWTGVVLSLSSEEFAAARTSRFVLPLLRWMLPWADPATLEILHLGIRKLAHAVEYAILAALVVRGFHGVFRLQRAREGLQAILFVAGVAAADESRQALSSMRTGSIWDWALDVSGALLALVLLYGRRERCPGGRGRALNV